MPQSLPAELCDEIIGYLWDDSRSLRDCSLANKVMIIPCQRRLFHRIVLHRKSGGTSAKFFKLLMKSPHIAGYVRFLIIYDHYNERHDIIIDSGDPLDAPMFAYTKFEEYSRGRLWLPQDKYLPHFAPLLCNLRGLIISYTGPWKHLSFRVFSSLVHMMQLPSLLYLQLDPSVPDCIIDLAVGENVKRLSVGPEPVCHVDEPLLVHQLSHPPSGPVCIESLSASSSQFLETLLGATPRISTRCLRKLVLELYDWPVAQAFLENCGALEDLKVIVDGDSCGTLDTLDPKVGISLGKLTTMARFTASLGFARELYDGTLKTNMPWLCQVLLSGSTLGNQALREITIGVACYYGKDYYSISEWKEIFGALNRYPNLTVLNIIIGTYNLSGQVACEKLFDLLDTCDDVGRLRTRKNVDVRVCQVSSCHLQHLDFDWTPWKNISSQTSGA